MGNSNQSKNSKSLPSNESVGGDKREQIFENKSKVDNKNKKLKIYDGFESYQFVRTYSGLSYHQFVIVCI